MKKEECEISIPCFNNLLPDFATFGTPTVRPTQTIQDSDLQTLYEGLRYTANTILNRDANFAEQAFMALTTILATAKITNQKWGLRFINAGIANEVYKLPRHPNAVIKLVTTGELQTTFDRVVQLQKAIDGTTVSKFVCPTVGIFLHSSLGVKANITRLPYSLPGQYQEWDTTCPFFYTYPGAEPDEIPILQDIIIQAAVQADPPRSIKPRPLAKTYADSVFNCAEWWEDIIQIHGVETATTLYRAWRQCLLDGHRGNIGWTVEAKRPVIIDL